MVRKKVETRNGVPLVGERILVAKTCWDCGLLRDAKHFTKPKGRTWNPHCGSCKARKYRQSVKAREVYSVTVRSIERKHQKESVGGATRSGTPYTEADIKYITKALKEGMTHYEIAEKLGRSFYSIKSATTRYGLYKYKGRK